MVMTRRCTSACESSTACVEDDEEEEQRKEGEWEGEGEDARDENMANAWFPGHPGLSSREAEFQYNNHIYSTTKYTPFMLDTGRNPCMGFEPWPLNSTNETANEFFERMKLVQEEVKAALAKAKDDMARYYDQCCIPAPEYKPGDCMYLDASNIETMRPSNCYLGPYTVERQVGRIQAPSTTLYEPPPPHVQRHQAPPCSPSSRLLPLQTPDSDIRTRT
ncbi:hypothetical protein LshimejAT787_0604690 [Lyophyllum shimeji]|uniref:Uncharacterized protein n=1 Tax=Lyophyllum shimeji TaxID=47721 RepID=A0A9P3PMX2_LYOSH|nr:hypothetical protein LshimejAT787_0604690 [Lyophyllum shimeji]